MIHYGDITKISGYEVPIVDCVVGGSPCQNLSVAGNREGLDAYNQCLTGDVALTLRSARGDNEHLPLVVMDRSAYNQGENAKFNIGIDEDGVAFSHIAKGPGAVCYIDTSHLTMGNEKAQTLRARDYKEPLAVCYIDTSHADDVVAPLQARDYKGGKLIAITDGEPVICLQGNQIDQADTSVCNGSGFKVCYKKPHYIVRRLTPLECERLQGYPDGWTDIGEYIDSKGRKKKTSDTARYKALGNSIALPPWKWIIKRLCSHYERDATLASLFDGIGGFPCLWEQINGKGSAVWASEIEDFPIAVTQVRIE